MRKCTWSPVLIPAMIAALSAFPASAQQPASTVPRDLFLTVGRSLIVDSPVDIQRVSVAEGKIAEAVVVGPREIVVNGKAPGITSLIVWQGSGSRLLFDLNVRPVTALLEAVQRQIERELGDQVSVALEDGNVFVRGTVNDLTAAERAIAIAGTLGKPVNLLRVQVPPAEAQILLKVRFADVDRAASSDLGANILSIGALNTVGSVGTQQFAAPQVSAEGGERKFSLTDALNVFLFRPDLNLGATIKALENRRLLQILAEPNVLAINGRPASFLAGGEFPFPTLQGGGAGLGAVTIQFREFGVRINFTPVITPRGTIRLQVTPEVSSLDFANGLVFQGFNIPALATRRVQTEIELENGQSFVIGGLLDNRMTENFNKIPGLGDIPLLGKIFQSRALNRSNTELLVLVTPELVRPIPAGVAPPEVKMPQEFLSGTAAEAPRTPGLAVTGPVPVTPPQATIPVEQLIESQKRPQPNGPSPQMPPIQIIPVPVAPAPLSPERLRRAGH
jgi:pilus assembly protein CpaC